MPLVARSPESPPPLAHASRQLQGPHQSALARLLLLLLLLAPAGLPRHCLAVELEANNLLWRLAQSDGVVRLESHRRVDQAGSLGADCEAIRVRAYNASYVHVVRSIPECYAIDDLSVSLPIRSDHRGIELWARVVFPRSSHPAHGRPMTTMFAGDRYDRVGEWESLTLQQIRSRVQAAAKLLRYRFGTDVDEAGAYLDALVLNVYTGPGVGETWIARPEIEGVAPVAIRQLAAWQMERQGASSVSSEPSRPIDPRSPLASGVLRVEADQLLVQGRPQFFRAVTYRGESCQRLARFGFNTLVFLDPPEVGLLEEASAAGFWWLAPARADGVPEALYRSRLLGEPVEPKVTASDEVDSLDVQLARLWQSTEYAAPAIRGRPDACFRIRIHHRLAVPTETPRDSTLSLWHQASLPTVSWAAVSLEGPELVVQQAQLLGREGAGPYYRDVDTLRYVVRRAIARGCRGLWYQTQHPLSTDGQASPVRRINAELQLIEPFLAGGIRLSRTNHNDQDVVLRYREATLIVPHRPLHPLGGSEQPWQGTLQPSTASRAAYRLALDGLQRIATERVAGAIRLTAVEPRSDATYLLTEDSQIVQQLSQRSWQLGRDLFESELQRIEQRTSWLDHLPQVADNAALRTSIDAHLGRSRRLQLEQNVRQAFCELQQGDELLAGWQRQAVRFLIVQSPAARGSICCQLLATLPAATELQREIEQRNPSENLLPQGSCEDPSAMVATGWRIWSPNPESVARISVTRRVQREGACAAVLQVHPHDVTRPDLASAESPRRCLLSPTIPCQAGDILRISGWFYADPRTSQLQSSFLLASNWEPETSLVELPAVAGWQPFDHYLMVGEQQSIVLHLWALGSGNHYVDQLEVIRYPAPNRLARRAE